VSAGKKFVIFGSPGTFSDKKNTNPAIADKFLARLGLKITERWSDRPFNVEYIYETPEMFLSTKPYERLRPPYPAVHAISEENQVHLRARGTGRIDSDSDLIITGPHGGYIAEGYIFRTNMSNGDEVAQRLINPFEFFRLAFDTDGMPKPDTTTIAGRRIYYSN